jgi:hypothetical protein
MRWKMNPGTSKPPIKSTVKGSTKIKTTAISIEIFSWTTKKKTKSIQV